MPELVTDPFPNTMLPLPRGRTITDALPCAWDGHIENIRVYPANRTANAYDLNRRAMWREVARLPAPRDGGLSVVVEVNNGGHGFFLVRLQDEPPTPSDEPPAAQLTLF